VGCLGVHLGAVGIGESQDVARELDDHALHAQAYAKGGNVMLACVNVIPEQGYPNLI
jgi:hypothetical protein